MDAVTGRLERHPDGPSPHSELALAKIFLLLKLLN